MGSIAAIIGTLLAGGKVAGLTLTEIEAIISLVLKYEPQIKSGVDWIKQVEPELYAALTKTLAAATKPVTTIPGYAADGSVVGIHNPDSKK